MHYIAASDQNKILSKSLDVIQLRKKFTSSVSAPVCTVGSLTAGIEAGSSIVEKRANKHDILTSLEFTPEKDKKRSITLLQNDDDDEVEINFFK